MEQVQIMVASGPGISVAVVNDYPVVVAGVVALLAPYERLLVKGYGGAIPRLGEADVVLFDPFGRPDAGHRVRELVASSGAKVLVYGWAESQSQVEEAIDAGAFAFLSKTVNGAAIVAALEAAFSDDPVRAAGINADAVKATASRVGGMAAWPGGADGLTPRESEIVSLIVAGLTNDEIARSAYLSINSVKTYIRTAYRKMGVKTRSQAILWGIDHGFRADLGGLKIEN